MGKKFEISKNWKGIYRKVDKVIDKLVQNYSKANVGTVLKNNEILRKILQNQGKYSQNFDKLLMIFYKKMKKFLGNDGNFLKNFQEMMGTS